MKTDSLKYVMIAVIGLSLLVTGTALSAQLTGGTSTQAAPSTGPEPSTEPESSTGPATSPSTTPSMEYESVDKPPVRTLDIPDVDIAGDLRIVETRWRGQSMYIYYNLALMNKGKRNIEGRVQYRIRLIYVPTRTLFKETNKYWHGPTIRTDYWVLPDRTGRIIFEKGAEGAPSELKDVKMIVDIDPDNTFGEAQRYRENNRCIATW